MPKKGRKKSNLQEAGESMCKHRKIGGVERRAILEQTNIPEAYHKKAVVKKGDNGEIHIYYGGIGAGDYYFHGHMVIGNDGKMCYHRLPFSKYSRAEHYVDGIVQRDRKFKRRFYY